MRPDQLTVSKDRTILNVAWPDRRLGIPATRLRAMARDAVSLRARYDHGEAAADPDLTITDVRMVGAMGVNVVFSDGHDRAIYPWAFLREIAMAHRDDEAVDATADRHGINSNSKRN